MNQIRESLHDSLAIAKNSENPIESFVERTRLLFDLLLAKNSPPIFNQFSVELDFLLASQLAACEPICDVHRHQCNDGREYLRERTCTVQPIRHEVDYPMGARFLNGTGEKGE